jgi:hypothetical protein
METAGFCPLGWSSGYRLEPFVLDGFDGAVESVAFGAEGSDFVESFGG